MIFTVERTVIRLISPSSIKAIPTIIVIVIAASAGLKISIRPMLTVRSAAIIISHHLPIPNDFESTAIWILKSPSVRIAMPSATQRKLILHNRSHRTLHHKRVLCHFRELCQLSFAHYFSKEKLVVPMFCPSAKMSTR